MDAMGDALIAEDYGFVVAGQAGALGEARPALHDADVLIVDLTLPDGYGGDLIPELQAANPDAHAKRIRPPPAFEGADVRVVLAELAWAPPDLGRPG